MYPVEVRYRPVARRGRRRRPHADGRASSTRSTNWPASAAATCWCSCRASARSARAAEALRKHHSARRAAEILPLFARLSAQEQERVFRPGGGAAHRAGDQRGRDLADRARHPLRGRHRPGARQALHATATRSSSCRSSRSRRPRPTSAPAAAAAWPTASASGSTTRTTSRSGPRFTDPEILRSSLAAVILRMKSLGLGDVERVSVRRAAAAPRDRRRLPAARRARRGRRPTTSSRDRPRAGEAAARSAHRPHDPRRARRSSCLAEVLIIASALSVQDPRERPLERAAGGRRGAQAGSPTTRVDFLSLVKLWNFVQEKIEHKKSNRKLTDDLQSHFLSSAPHARVERHARRSCRDSRASRAGASTRRRRPTSSCTARCSPACSATSAAHPRRRPRRAAVPRRARHQVPRLAGLGAAEEGGRAG